MTFQRGNLTAVVHAENANNRVGTTHGQPLAGVVECHRVNIRPYRQRFGDLTRLAIPHSRIAREIAKKIEAEMTYPGEVKVTCLREVRAVEYAR